MTERSDSITERVHEMVREAAAEMVANRKVLAHEAPDQHHDRDLGLSTSVEALCDEVERAIDDLRERLGALRILRDNLPRELHDDVTRGLGIY